MAGPSPRAVHAAIAASAGIALAKLVAASFTGSAAMLPEPRADARAG